jgi:serine/threonine protein kinase
MAAAALDFAHRRSVIHRNIQLENVLLQDGMPLVADFGIAVALTTAGGDRLAETGLSRGTPACMSPEQIAGEGRIDARSDVYALACWPASCWRATRRPVRFRPDRAHRRCDPRMQRAHT